jgi:hypothetical protein
MNEDMKAVGIYYIGEIDDEFFISFCESIENNIKNNDYDLNLILEQESLREQEKLYYEELKQAEEYYQEEEEKNNNKYK